MFTSFFKRKFLLNVFKNLTIFKEFKMYKKVDANLNFPNEEKEVLKFWRENDVKKQCMNHNAGARRFSF